MSNKRLFMGGVFLVLLAIGFVYLIGYMNSLDGNYDNPGPWYVGPTILVSFFGCVGASVGAFACFLYSVSSDAEDK